MFGTTRDFIEGLNYNFCKINCFVILSDLPWNKHALTCSAAQVRCIWILYSNSNFRNKIYVITQEFCDFMSEMISMMNNVKDEVLIIGF